MAAEGQLPVDIGPLDRLAPIHPTAGAEGAGATAGRPLEGANFPLADVLPDGVVVADAAGRIVYANHAVELMLGWSPAVLLGQPVTVLIPPRLRSACGSAFAAFAADGRPHQVSHPRRLPALTVNGAESPIELVLSVLPTGTGERLVVATLRSVVGQIDLERHGQVVDRLLGVLALGPDDARAQLVEVVADSLDWDVGALWARDPDGITVRPVQFWHRPGLDVGLFESATESATFTVGAGLPGRVLADSAPAWIADLAFDGDFERAEVAGAVGLRSGFAFPIFTAAGVTGVLEMFARSRRPPDDALLADMAAIGRRIGEILAHGDIERRREGLVAELRLVQARQKELLRTQDFVLQAARVLAQAADYTEALDRLAAVAVPLLGDLCLIDVLAEDKTLVRMAACHADPLQQPTVDELRARYPPDPNGEHPSAEVIRSRRSRWSPDMSDEFLRATTRDEHHLALVRRLNFTSYMSLPLMIDDRVFGSLTLVAAGSGRRFRHSDLALAEELAGHAAAVIDTARRQDREHNAAHALQRSLLPDRLPSVAGVTAAARYLPGTEGAEVGGDWYDVMALNNGAVGLAIGDVAGHDIGAASEMGQLRNALRAYAFRNDSPVMVLDELRRFFDLAGIERIATVTYLWLAPASGELRVASAGHLPPVIRRRCGDVEIMEISPAPPLGAPSQFPIETGAVLESGDTIILMTGGLIETRDDDLDNGFDRLAEVLRSIDSANPEAPNPEAPNPEAPNPEAPNPEALCDGIVKHLIAPGQHRDDVALLVVQRQ